MHKLGLKRGFSVLDADDSSAIVKELLPAAVKPDQLSALRNLVSAAKNNGLAPDAGQRTRAQPARTRSGDFVRQLSEAPGGVQCGGFRRPDPPAAGSCSKPMRRRAPPGRSASAICSSTNTRTPMPRNTACCNSLPASAARSLRSATTTSRSTPGAARMPENLAAARPRLSAAQGDQARTELSLHAAHPARGERADPAQPACP